jgi:hypothetical protein
MPRMSPSSEAVLDNRPAANAENSTLETPLAQSAPLTLGGSTGALAGCQFLDCLTWTEGRETWTARTEDGGDRLVQFFSGIHWEGDKEKERLNFLHTLRHDAVEPMELIAGPDHKLVLITEACPKTLATRFQECQTAGLPGIPRPELLARLNTAAEALDDLSEEHGVRHLGLTPRHLVLKNGRLRLLHWGVAELIRLSTGGQAAAANPRYSAPASSEEPHPSSDAYSLALIYCELLTGVHPLRQTGSRKSAPSRRQAPPDLSLLSRADKAVLLRALHTDPNRRFASCTDFMAALGADSANSSTPAPCGPTTSLSCDLADAVFPTAMLVRMRQIINSLVAGAAGDLEVREYRNARFLLRPGCCLEHQFFARITQGVSRLMADGFRFQWKAKLVESNERRVVLLIPLTASLWLRLRGIRPGLKVAIDMPQNAAGAISEVRVRIEPVGCEREAALAVMEEAAPKLLDSLRTFYQAQPERRSQARLPFDQVLEVLPVLEGCKEGEVVSSRARDISMQGMKLYMPCRPPSQQVNIRLPGWSSGHVASLPAAVVRTIPCDDGGYEVGLCFLVDEVPQSR